MYICLAHTVDLEWIVLHLCLVRLRDLAFFIMFTSAMFYLDVQDLLTSLNQIHNKHRILLILLIDS